MSKRAPVAVLQQLCSLQGVTQPVYKEFPQEDQSIFVVSVEAYGITRQGNGSSLKVAKHMAAQELLKVLKGVSDLRQKILGVEEELVNFTGALQADCSQRQLPKPRFHFDYSEIDRQTTATCSVEDFQTTAWDHNEKVAKEKAAKAMLELLGRSHKAPEIPPHDKKQRFFLSVDPDRYERAKRLLESASAPNEEQLLKRACKELDIPFRKFNVKTQEGAKEIIQVTCSVTYVHVAKKKKACSEVLGLLKDLMQVE